MNADPKTVAAFGHEWTYFPQTPIDRDQRKRAFDAYFLDLPMASAATQFGWYIVARAIGFPLSSAPPAKSTAPSLSCTRT
jgi:hypothetical protein